MNSLGIKKRGKSSIGLPKRKILFLVFTLFLALLLAGGVTAFAQESGSSSTPPQGNSTSQAGGDSTSGAGGTSGTSGTSGDGSGSTSDTGGTSGTSGTTGDGSGSTSGTGGTSGTSGATGDGAGSTSGAGGTSGSSGTTGDGSGSTSGAGGTSGSSGTSGDGTGGTSGAGGTSGSSGTSGDGSGSTSGTSSTASLALGGTQDFSGMLLPIAQDASAIIPMPELDGFLGGPVAEIPGAPYISGDVPTPMMRVPEPSQTNTSTPVTTPHEPGIFYENGNWFYYDESGKAMGGFVQTDDGRTVFFDPIQGMLYGEQTIAGETYYLDPETGDVTRNDMVSVGGNNYYFDLGGHMVQGEQVVHNGHIFLFGLDGNRVDGLYELLDGRTVYFDGGVGMHLGEFKDGNARWWYYDIMTGEQHLEFTQLPDGRVVYYDETLGMLVGEQSIDGAGYYFSRVNGDMTTSEMMASGNTAYYYGANGKQVQGEQVVHGGHIFLFGLDGKRVDGLYTLLDGRTVYFDGGVGMHLGEFKDSQARWWYYDVVTGERHLEFTKLPDGRDVYYDASKGMIVGEQSIGGEGYYFSRVNGDMATNEMVTSGNTAYYYGANGEQARGEQVVHGGHIFLFGLDGKRVDGLTTLLDGRTVYFDGGVGMHLGEFTDSSGKRWYYDILTGARHLGFTTLPDGRNVYYDSTQGMLFGEHTIDGKVYHFDEKTGNVTPVEPEEPSGNQIITVYDISSGKLVTDTVHNILSRIVASEVGGSGSAEMYKAQSIASYSWLMYNYQNYPSLTPRVFLGTATSAIEQAVSDVSGQYLSYHGSVALAMYGASTSGITNNAVVYFGNNSLPYLQTVPDPYGVTHAGQISTWNTTQMADAIQKMTGYRPVGTDYASWVQLQGVGGYITGATVNGYTTTASTFYDNLWGLYSPYVQSFTYNGNGTWTAVTSGNGHGIGMSHTGAIYYAKSGWSHSQILAHYYPSTAISTGNI